MYRRERPFWFGILLIFIVFSIIYGVTRIPVVLFAEPSFVAMIQLMLSLTIMLFAIVEGFSTYLQVVDNRNMRRFENLQEELEKSYGPLYSLVVRPDEVMSGHSRGEEFVIEFFIEADE